MARGTLTSAALHASGMPRRVVLALKWRFTVPIYCV